ncbi:MAG: hypothetical protein UH071_02905 [Paludibacteraceae bacterium]|nr:hypothetical protein [Paludibacteraceae bacterium]
MRITKDRTPLFDLLCAPLSVDYDKTKGNQTNITFSRTENRFLKKRIIIKPIKENQNGKY